MIYNLLFVGTNWVSSNCYEGLKYVPKINPYAIYSRTREKGEIFQKKHNIEVLYTSYDEALLDKGIDIVYIASPNHIHFEQAKKAILAKKHILIEKPMTISCGEAETLYKLAKANNVFIMEALSILAVDNYQRIKKYLQSTQEKVTGVRMTLKDIFDDTTTPNLYRNLLSQGGGALYDLGPYALASLLDLFGYPDKITFADIRNSHGADVQMTLILRYQYFLATVELAMDSRSSQKSEINLETHHIELAKISRFEEVTIGGKTFKTAKASKFIGQLKHFAEVLDSKNYTSTLFTSELSLNLQKIYDFIHLEARKKL